MGDHMGAGCGRDGDSCKKLVNAYNVLSYIDSISPDEMQYASKLVKEELSVILSELGKKGDKKESCGLEEEKNEKEDGDGIKGHEIQEDNEAIGKIKKIGSEIQYNYITRVNLQLLREFGDEAWGDQVKKLKDLRQLFQEEQSDLKKNMKRISLNRKKRQLEFRDNELGPLLDDLKRIQNENNSLIKTLIKMKKGNRK
ncbi:uncharacterized protein ELE39_003122 [Cryptosporidium sp. chipmunk genotype I]|uniref:uncharacterized protein n=1 Tax=Cryptosporidium sp. chipmunk genotype I TaxID=1280935 RepID=UPI00351A7991|nr:hypothetical protein ELE39_003122 [Cryptosporidium sp. chipmunk genotype I]